MTTERDWGVKRGSFFPATSSHFSMKTSPGRYPSLTSPLRHITRFSGLKEERRVAVEVVVLLVVVVVVVVTHWWRKSSPGW